MLTVGEVREALPAHLKGAASQSLVDRLNAAAGSPEDAEVIRENFVSYASVLKEGRFRPEDYVNAVVYVSFKLLGDTNRDAYRKTFPQRWRNFAARGCTEKEISSYVAHYNRGQLVNLILEQSLVPTWVLNQHLYQKAINTQADLMMTAKSEKVRSAPRSSMPA